MPRGWLTPDEIPEATKCRLLRIPDNLDIIMAVSGALVELTKEYNWQPFGSVTPEQISDAMRAMYFEFMNSLNDCEEPVSVPVGTIVQFAAETPPDGWLYCDGRERLKADYAALYAVIGDVWGTPPSGSDYFMLPDFYNRSPYGWKPAAEGGTKAFASEHGAETHLLTTSQIPSHTHDYATGAGSGSVGNDTVYSAGVFLSPRLQTGAAGGGNAHNNLHPVTVVSFIIFAGV